MPSRRASDPEAYLAGGWRCSRTILPAFLRLPAHQTGSAFRLDPLADHTFRQRPNSNLQSVCGFGCAPFAVLAQRQHVRAKGPIRCGQIACSVPFNQGAQAAPMLRSIAPRQCRSQRMSAPDRGSRQARPPLYLLVRLVLSRSLEPSIALRSASGLSGSARGRPANRRDQRCR